jgi:hypothetical protein
VVVGVCNIKAAVVAHREIARNVETCLRALPVPKPFFVLGSGEKREAARR